MNSISSIPNIFYKLAAVKQRKPIDPAFCVVVDAVFVLDLFQQVQLRLSYNE